MLNVSLQEAKNFLFPRAAWEREKAMAVVPDSVSLVDELIAERRLEAKLKNATRVYIFKELKNGLNLC